MLNNLNEMLNLIWLFNPNFAFQSCRTPPDCNYTFLYLSIMGTPCYMLIYNYLRLSETLPHEFFTYHYQLLISESRKLPTLYIPRASAVNYRLPEFNNLGILLISSQDEQAILYHEGYSILYEFPYHKNSG